MQRVGTIKGIYRYPVKSMAGESLSRVRLGWNGLEGDRRAGFVRSGVMNGRPWLTASKLPALVTYQPFRNDGAAGDSLPAFVRTPSGAVLELSGEPLRAELEALCGEPVALIPLKNGIFDDAPLSFITTSTVAAITQAAELPEDVRRFRPNFLIETDDAVPFTDDQWLGRIVRIGEGDGAPTVAICMKDVRCVMINLDPATASSDARMLKAAVRLNSNCAGVYATATRTGEVRVGDVLYLQ